MGPFVAHHACTDFHESFFGSPKNVGSLLVAWRHFDLFTCALQELAKRECSHGCVPCGGRGSVSRYVLHRGKKNVTGAYAHAHLSVRGDRQQHALNTPCDLNLDRVGEVLTYRQ
jgi:hypothetical protein